MSEKIRTYLKTGLPRWHSGKEATCQRRRLSDADAVVLRPILCEPLLQNTVVYREALTSENLRWNSAICQLNSLGKLLDSISSSVKWVIIMLTLDTEVEALNDIMHVHFNIEPCELSIFDKRQWCQYNNYYYQHYYFFAGFIACNQAISYCNITVGRTPLRNLQPQRYESLIELFC